MTTDLDGQPIVTPKERARIEASAQASKLRTVIAFDLGTQMGWAVMRQSPAKRGEAVACTPELHIASGTFDLSTGRHSSPGMRYIHAGKNFADLLESNQNPVVFYEEVRRHLGVDASHVYGGLLAVLQSECIRRGVDFQGIPVGTIKKRATNKGNAKKEHMIAIAAVKWPQLNIVDDNHADALWCAVCGVEMIGGGRC